MNETAPGRGLDMAKRYWREWGRPWLASRHPALLNRIGVGLFSGSDVLGADDALSRDHGWGPRFDVFLAEGDAPGAETLQSELRAAAPRDWGDVSLRFDFIPAIQVHAAGDYFGGPFPQHRLPQTPADWVCCEHKLPNLESHLHFVRHGAVFHDPAGLLAGMQDNLRVYPGDVWHLRMAQLCFEIAHFGEYNFCWRLVRRDDPVAAEMAAGAFLQAAMALALVMDRDYAPYWKWMRHVFRHREMAARLDADLVAISTTLDKESRAARIRSACAVLMEEMVKREILPADLDDGSGLPIFFQARARLLENISDPAILALMK